jgi:serine/threonine protein phosphatase PrpC
VQTRADADVPAHAPPRLDYYGASHVGKVRERNEDHFAIMALQHSARLLLTNLDDTGMVQRLSRPDAHVFMAADGVGGLAGGEEASRLAVGTIMEYLSEAASCYRGTDVGQEQEFMDRLSAGVERAHRRLIQTYGAERGPATTLTMVTLVWPRAYVVHVGDSRGYVLRRGRLRQFTADQTMGDLYVNIGRGSEEQAEKLGLYNILSSAVGTDMAPVVGVVDLEPDDVLLVCTDGLTNHVPDARITELLTAAPDAESACRELVDAALAGGGRDNVTVIVARFAPASA